MIKSILVPATGSGTDNVVFASALTVARAFDAHLYFLHVRVDAAAMAATMAFDGSGAAMITGLVDRMDDEANQREEKSKQLFERFCERDDDAAIKEDLNPADGSHGKNLWMCRRSPAGCGQNCSGRSSA